MGELSLFNTKLTKGRQEVKFSAIGTFVQRPSETSSAYSCPKTFLAMTHNISKNEIAVAFKIFVDEAISINN